MPRLTPLAALIGSLVAGSVTATSLPAVTSDNTTDLPRILVTAPGSSLKLDVPGTVSVIDRVQMDRHLVLTIRDLVRYEPGVSAIGAGGRFGLDSFNIRGLSGNRTRIEIDGISLPASFGADIAGGSFRAGRNAIDLDDIAAVTIVRGPASALYPSDALGGVVSLRTKDPADYLKQGRRSYVAIKEQTDSADRSVTSTLTLAGGNAHNGLLFAASHRESHESSNKGDVGGTGAARTRPDPQNVALDSFLGKYVHTASSGRIDRVTVDGSQTRTRTDGLSQLSANVGYYRAEDANRRLRAGYEQQFPRLDGWLADTLDWHIYGQDSRTHTRTQTENIAYWRYFDTVPVQEKVLGGKLIATKALGNHQSLSYGVELSRTKAHGEADGHGVDKATGAVGHTTPALPGDYPLHLIPSSRTDRYALFAQDDIALASDRLTITPGLRLERYAYHPASDALYAAYNPGYVRRDVTAKRATPKLGLLWRLTDTLSVYADYSQGFRPPLYSEIAGAWNEHPFPGFNIAFLPNDHLKSETSRNAEIGLRGRGDAGWFSVGAYLNRYRNFIWSGYAVDPTQVPSWYALPPGMNLLFQSVNARRAQIKGAEASGVLQLEAFSSSLQGWSLRASASVASGKLIEPGDDGYSPLNTVDPAKLVAGVSYDAEHWGLELVGTAVRRHTRLSDPSAFRPGGYATLDLYAHFAPSERLELYAGLANLTDRTYWDWGSLNSGALGNLVTGNGLNDAGTGGLPAARLTMPGRSINLAAKLIF